MLHRRQGGGKGGNGRRCSGGENRCHGRLKVFLDGTAGAMLFDIVITQAVDEQENNVFRLF